MYYPPTMYSTPYYYPPQPSGHWGGSPQYQIVDYAPAPYKHPSPIRDEANRHPAFLKPKAVDVFQPEKSPLSKHTPPASKLEFTSHNPFTSGLIRYGGFTNEFGEAFYDPLKETLKKYGKGKLADTILAATYNIVFAYCILDAAYVGTKSYFAARHEGHSHAYARTKALKSGVGEGIFQMLASYLIPAKLIKYAFNPAGKKLGEMLQRATTASGKQTSSALGRLLLKNASKLPPFCGTVVSLLSIPLMVKLLDPFIHGLVKKVWLNPLNKMIQDAHNDPKHWLNKTQLAVKT